MHRLSVIFAIIACLVQVSANEVLDKGELVFVQLIFHHGDRAPTRTYSDEANWLMGLGNLTNEGKSRQYELGKYERQRYSGLLSEIYKPDELLVITTDSNLTRISAYAHLAGLYAVPWDSNSDPTKLTKIPVTTDLNGIINMKESCRKYNFEQSFWKNSTEYRQLDEQFLGTYTLLSTVTGEEVIDAEQIYTDLLIEQMSGKKSPMWKEMVFPEPLRTMAAKSLNFTTYTRSLARKRSGALLQDIMDGFDAKAAGNLTLKMKLYSGNDATVASLLGALKLFDMHPPPFAACIMMELRMYQNQSFVSVVYKNDTEDKILEIPECGVACSLEQMKQLYADMLVDDWEAECRYYGVDHFLDIGNTWSIVYVGFSAVTMVMVVVFIVVDCRRRHAQRGYENLVGDE